MPGLNEPSWLVWILQFVEQKALEDRWDVYAPYLSHPTAVRNQALPVYLCPELHSADSAVVGYQTFSNTLACGCPGGRQVAPGGAYADYVANRGGLSPGAAGLPTDIYWGGLGIGVIISSSPKQSNDLIDRDWLDKIRLTDVIDGTSHTFLIGEPHIPRSEVGKTPYNGPA